MKTLFKLRPFLVVIGTILHFMCISQDLHYSQFYNSPQNLNPSLTGLYNGDQRFILSHRDQWRYVPVPWTTFSGAYDQKLYPSKRENIFFGVGGNLNYDRQGDSKLTLFGLGLNGAIHKTFSSKIIGSIGANLGWSSRGFNTKQLRWDKQWNGEVFDSKLGSEEFFANTETINFLETGLGANVRWQKSARTNVGVGLGASHIIQPKASFLGDKDSKLPMRLSISGVGDFRVAEKVNLQIHALQQLQTKYRETVVGALVKLYLNQNRGKELDMHLGLGYRTSGSLIPTLAFQYNNWYISGNLDMDSTPFNKTLNTSRGAYELHVKHVIHHVKSFRFKNCPVL
jgi:type IX secretion system PorP/SprF family membrane protein